MLNYIRDISYSLYSLVDVFFPKTGPDGLPLPPTNLRFLVAGTHDADWFIEGGKLGAASIRNILHKNGISLEQLPAVFDFGCGVGRVIRHWHDLQETAVYGSDYNQKLIKWCQKNLTFANFSVNQLQPPLPFTDKQFDLIYALSVFTHMPEELQLNWIAELSRVLKPGGYLFITTHGEFYLNHLTETEKMAFHAGQLIVHAPEKAGENYCAAFHPPIYIREKLAPEFHLVDFVPEGALGNPRQDVSLLKKR